MNASAEIARCPYCAEPIQAAARKCKHCGEIIDPVLRETRAQPPQRTQERLWSPGIAAILSLIIPGAGQMYKGNVGAGLIWFFCVILGYVALVIPGLVLHVICILTAASGDPTKRGG